VVAQEKTKDLKTKIRESYYDCNSTSLSDEDVNLIYSCINYYKYLSHELIHYPEKTFKDIFCEESRDEIHYACDLSTAIYVLEHEVISGVRPIPFLTLPLVKKYMLDYPIIMSLSVKNKTCKYGGLSVGLHRNKVNINRIYIVKSAMEEDYLDYIQKNIKKYKVDLSVITELDEMQKFMHKKYESFLKHAQESIGIRRDHMRRSINQSRHKRNHRKRRSITSRPGMTLSDLERPIVHREINARERSDYDRFTPSLHTDRSLKKIRDVYDSNARLFKDIRRKTKKQDFKEVQKEMGFVLLRSALNGKMQMGQAIYQQIKEDLQSKVEQDLQSMKAFLYKTKEDLQRKLSDADDVNKQAQISFKNVDTSIENTVIDNTKYSEMMATLDQMSEKGLTSIIRYDSLESKSGYTFDDIKRLEAKTDKMMQSKLVKQSVESFMEWLDSIKLAPSRGSGYYSRGGDDHEGQLISYNSGDILESETREDNNGNELWKKTNCPISYEDFRDKIKNYLLEIEQLYIQKYFQDFFDKQFRKIFPTKKQKDKDNRWFLKGLYQASVAGKSSVRSIFERYFADLVTLSVVKFHYEKTELGDLKSASIQEKTTLAERIFQDEVDQNFLSAIGIENVDLDSSVLTAFFQQETFDESKLTSTSSEFFNQILRKAPLTNEQQQELNQIEDEKEKENRHKKFVAEYIANINLKDFLKSYIEEYIYRAGSPKPDFIIESGDVKAFFEIFGGPGSDNNYLYKQIEYKIKRFLKKNHYPNLIYVQNDESATLKNVYTDDKEQRAKADDVRNAYATKKQIMPADDPKCQGEGGADCNIKSLLEEGNLPNAQSLIFYADLFDLKARYVKLEDLSGSGNVLQDQPMQHYFFGEPLRQKLCCAMPMLTSSEKNDELKVQIKDFIEQANEVKMNYRKLVDEFKQKNNFFERLKKEYGENLSSNPDWQSLVNQSTVEQINPAEKAASTSPIVALNQHINEIKSQMRLINNYFVQNPDLNIDFEMIKLRVENLYSDLQQITSYDYHDLISIFFNDPEKAEMYVQNMEQVDFDAMSQSIASLYGEIDKLSTNMEAVFSDANQGLTPQSLQSPQSSITTDPSSTSMSFKEYKVAYVGEPNVHNEEGPPGDGEAASERTYWENRYKKPSKVPFMKGDVVRKRYDKSQQPATGRVIKIDDSYVYVKWKSGKNKNRIFRYHLTGEMGGNTKLPVSMVLQKAD